MEVTVVIPTYNGVNKLPGILEALTLQSYKNFEVLVVIDGSTDGTIEMLSSIKLDLPSVRIIAQKNAGRSVVRNRGVNEAKGNLIIFYDDDMIPATDSVRKHLNFHIVNENALLTGYTPQLVNSNSSDFHCYRAHISNRWASAYPIEIFKMNESSLFLTAANCSMRKSTFLSLSGFDEVLTDAEDKDLAKRAYASGFNLYYDKQNVAFHNETVTCSAYVKRLREYALAEKKIFSENGSLRRRVEVSQLKKIFYFAFASAFLVKAIDSFNFFLALPVKVRYRIYDAITFSLSEIYPSIKV